MISNCPSSVPLVGTHTEAHKKEGIHLNTVHYICAGCVEVKTSNPGTLQEQTADMRPWEHILHPQEIATTVPPPCPPAMLPFSPRWGAQVLITTLFPNRGQLSPPHSHLFEEGDQCWPLGQLLSPPLLPVASTFNNSSWLDRAPAFLRFLKA